MAYRAFLAFLQCTAAAQFVSARVKMPSRVLDAHVHITNMSLFSYSGWANASAGQCPCAPPCACSWTVADWTVASASLNPQQLVFIEVDADTPFWLSEASWVQSQSDAGTDNGRIGAIVAHAPPGFGQPGVPDNVIARALDELLALPLAVGVRAYLNMSDPSSFPAAVSHTRLLALRGLSMDVCLGGLGGDPTASAFLVNLTMAVPAARFIVDHLGSPPVLGTAQQLAVWSSTMAALAAQPNVFVKIGGAFQYFKLCLTCPSTFPTEAQVSPFVTQVLQIFGFQRSLWEGNWFFVDWYAPSNLDVYSTWAAYTASILSGFSPTPSPAELDALFYGTGAFAYRVASP